MTDIEKLREKVEGMREAAYTFGDYSQEAVRVALDGVLDEIDELPNGTSALDAAIAEAVEPYRKDAERLRKALSLVLPLARGYAAAHPVGSNADYCDEADAALATKGGAA